MAGSGDAHLRPHGEVALSATNVVVEFPAGRRHVVHAVSDVSLDVCRGETLGIVGESGCGKSTLAKAMLRLVEPTSGEVQLGWIKLTALDKRAMREARTRIQMIFQDPISSLNPRRKVFDIVAEPLSIWKGKVRPGSESDQRVAQVLTEVGLDPEVARHRRAHEYSGGQCQRISVARALVLDPEVLVCDEPVSALDVSVQAQVLNLLEDMKQRYRLTMVFISHDLSVVRNVSDRVAVMYLGKLCEIGAGDALYTSAAHPYTNLLLAAVPDPGSEERPAGDVLEGELPSPIDPPSGCRFRTRCPRATDLCAAEEPTIAQVGDGDHWVACHFPVTSGG